MLASSDQYRRPAASRHDECRSASNHFAQTSGTPGQCRVIGCTWEPAGSGSWTTATAGAGRGASASESPNRVLSPR